MGFEVPLALLGLIAAAAPIAAHLLKRRELPVIPLPTVALLRRVQAQSRQRLRLVDLLLLCVRVLLVALLAVGVAEPFHSVRLAFGDGEVASVAIVLDDSFSMNQRIDGERAFDRARKRALDVVEALPTGAEVAVILAGNPARVVMTRTRDLTAARTLLEEALPSARGGELPRAVELAARELAGARHERRHMLVLSDLASHNALEEVRWPSAGVEVSVETVGEGEVANLAFTDVAAAPNPADPDELRVQVEVHSFGEATSDEVDVVLTRNGEELERARLNLIEGSATVTLEVAGTSQPTVGELHFEGSSDALPEDDRRLVPLRPPPALHVLLVDGDPDPTRDRDEVGFVARVLDLAPTTATAPIDYRTVDADAFDTERLDTVDVVILANVAATRARPWQRLREFVHRGGGLWIAPGNRFRAAPYSSNLGELMPARLRPAASATPALSVQPGVSGTLMPHDDHGFGGASVSRRVLLEDVDQGARVELVLSDASPLLVLGSYGQGRVALLTTTLDDDWSDLPLRPGFLPLVIRLLTTLSNRPPPLAGPFQAATPVDIPLPRSATEAELVDPSGRAIPIDMETPRFAETAQAGHYRLRVATGSSGHEDYPDGSFVVWPPPGESDLSTGAFETALVEGASEGAGALVRRPLAPWLFLIAGLLFVAEAWLRTRKGARAGAGRSLHNADRVDSAVT